MTRAGTFVSAVVVAILLSLGAAYVSETRSGRFLESHAREWIQVRLFDARPTTPLPVVVVDLAGIAATAASARSEPATSRETLTRLVTAIAKEGPKAIGIAIDFSPDNAGYVTEGDPEFFSFCLTLNKTGLAKSERRTPIFLGVERRASGPSFQWLGDEAFVPLAAGLFLPKAPVDSPVPLESRVNAPLEKLSLASLSFALARTVDPTLANRLEQTSFWTDALVKRRFTKGGDVDFRGYWADLSSVRMLEETTISVESPSLPPNALNRLRNRVVLIGDANAGEPFDVGEGRSAMGLFVHAAGVVTLLEGPLRVLNHHGRLVLDAGVLVGAAFMVGLLGWWRGAKGPIRLEKWLLKGHMALVVVLAFLLVAVTRVLWIDAPLVLVGLLIHPWAVKFVSRVPSRAATLWRKAGDTDE
jgi:CHASE2 domain-containing sensor protein